MLTDAMLDWVFLGSSSGDVFAYDLDRERPSSFRIPNFWREKDPMAMSVGLVGLQLHPRDIGKLLIAYTHGAVIFSFKQNVPTNFFEYQLPPGAPGGNGAAVNDVRKPKLTHALWHPSGTFVLTAHDDGSLVFWDSKDGRMLAARSLYKTKVNMPLPGPSAATPVAPFVKISWCCKENPDDTALLIAGGRVADDPESGLTFLDLGLTPVYATSSWEILASHFDGKRRLTLPTPPEANVINYCLVPRSSPHFDGAQDPIAVIAMLSSGELITMSFPSGYPISPTNMLHPSLSFVHPFVQKIAVSTVPRDRWLGMVEQRNKGASILEGGSEARKPSKRSGGRNVIQVVHADSIVRIWDVGFDDEIDNSELLQVDVARALNRFEDVSITSIDMAEVTGEFAAGTATGEVVVYRWGSNKYFGGDASQPAPASPGRLTDISSRAEPSLREGLQPLVLYEMAQGPVTALSVSDIGFVAVGSELGFFSIIDLRGPSIIYQASTAEFTKEEKRSFLKRDSKSAQGKDWPVVIEFGVMTLENDNYSSIACFVGTNSGRIATFKLLPSAKGYTVQHVGVASLDDKIIAICAMDADSGRPAAATGNVVASLREGYQVNGVLVAVTQTEIRVFKPATSKGASKSFGDQLCDAASVTECQLSGFALVALFGDRTARAYSLPGLKELGRSTLSMLDPSRTMSAVVTKTGDIVGWTGPSEITVLSVWGTGKGLENTMDTLVNPELLMPPRPTISNLQWISGTQYVSPTDLDLLIGGPDRPPSKRMIAAAAAEERQARSAGSARRGARAGSSQQQGWGEYLSQQLSERTEKLNFMGTMDNLQASSGWADDVGKYVQSTKRNMLLGGLKKSIL
ncbi:lethal giant larvae like, C-terminal-domain-containing protein [Lasiosphaeria miniovina]|uniref:Lethal giant larvae like, C-terminal-domain-containing protein n=1 Tax=Lasiosphaeria miniovina TaxID=1954250 RepID=A0AA40DRP0_9PEZI|nr:lethal giant larvae like, C-terminal-domain-containing protein [Lasiosphaeria miniovina]KAK0713075.1 lethal giant larvae like, C-terminal-domain-containing protein [Lasiosphaeria miniovina]